MCAFLNGKISCFRTIGSVILTCWLALASPLAFAQSEESLVELLSKGAKYYSEKRYRDALVPLRQALDETTDSPQLRVKYAESLFGTSACAMEMCGQFKEAAQMWELLGKTAPSYLNRSLDGQARSLLSAGMLKESLDIYDRLVVIDPSNRLYKETQSRISEKLGLNAALPSFQNHLAMSTSVAQNNETMNSGAQTFALAVSPERSSRAASDQVNKLADNFSSFYIKRGEASSQAGKPKEAIADYNHVLANPQTATPNTYIRRANAYIQLNDLNPALQDAQHAIKISPNYAEAYSTLGYIYFRLRRYQEAIGACTKALKMKPNLYEPYETAGMAYAETRSYKNAIDYYNAALRLNPQNVDLLTKLGDVQMIVGQAGQALASYNKALTIRPNAVDIVSKRAQAYRATGQQARAANDLAQVVKEHPGDTTAIVSYAQALDEAGKGNASVQCYTEAIKLNPRDKSAYIGRSQLYLNSQQYDLALRDCAACLAIDPRESQGHSGMANVYLRTGHLQQALAAAQKAVALDPRNASALYVLASVDEQQHQYASAESEAKQAMSNCPPLAPDCMMLIARARFASNDLNGCLQVLDQHLKLSDRDAAAYSMRGYVFETMKQYDRARLDFSQALKFDPSQDNLKLKRAECSTLLNDYLAAINDLHDFLQAHPSDQKVMLLLYQAQRANNDHGDALITLTSAIQLQANQADQANLYRLRAQEYDALHDAVSSAKDRKSADLLERGKSGQ
jgi:tetratricopeptide (TPR) repeat protein